ncbi:MAG TPA: nucleotidyltransferase family protein [Myxococcota bacterium]|nr:nucleotidyltransferase family protein [Myxococcota bacterium]
MKVVLLCAGYATRMYPLTRDLPKPLLEVAGAPILSHLLTRTAALPGVDEVVVMANHRFSPQLRAWAESARAAVPIRLVDDGSTDESNRLGALGDLELAAREIPLAGQDALVAAGDNLVLFDLEPLARVFARRRAPQLAVRRAAHGVSRALYNEVELDSASGRVERFREKPPAARSELAAIALYFLPASTWPLLERYLAEGGNRDAPGHFIAWLVRETPVYAEPIDGPWFDIGDLESLAQARAEARAPAGPRS